MTSLPVVAPSSCRNCRQQVLSTAPVCLWCGVQWPARPAAEADAAAGQAPAHPQQAASTQGYGGQASGGLATQRSAYGTTIAGTGRRLAALSVDASVLLVCVGTAALASRSITLTAVVALELAVAQWLLEARTGATIGAAVTRMRTTVVDRPYSPGAGRSLVRHALTGAGSLVGGVGAWLLVASSALDAQGRGVLDKASRTVAVAVPRSASAQQGALAAYEAPKVQHAGGLAAAQLRSDLVPTRNRLDDSFTASQTGTMPAGLESVNLESTTPPLVLPAAAPLAATPPAVTPLAATPLAAGAATPAAPAPLAPAPGVVPAAAQEPPAPAPAEPSVQAPAQPSVQAPAPAPAQSLAPAPAAPASTATGLLLVFDTGQRQTLTIPAAVNLGRKPTASEPGDQLVAVTDAEGTVSKTHARLEHTGGRTWVTDLGSTNGTELLPEDGGAIQLAAHVRTAVEDGTRVRIGNRAFTLSVMLGSPTGGGM